MPQIVRPQTKTKVKVVPREGELEITLNINITVDGQVTATAEGGEVTSIKQQKINDDEAAPMVPDFTSGVKLKFGKEDK